MPGKKDPDYFPLNFNMELYDYDYEEDDYEAEGSFAVSHGKYDSDGGGGTTKRTRNVSFNEMFVPPENSEVEEDEETASVQSSDIDADADEADVVDTLVLNIREKLRMGPKFTVTTSHHSSATNFWTEPPMSPSPYDSNTNSGCSSSHSHSSKRFRVHPYLWKSTRANSMGIQKNGGGGGGGKALSHHWWASRSFSDIRRGKTNPSSPSVDDPYQLLQELVDSGSLIKEAVRRIKTKRIGCINRCSSNSNNNASSAGGSSNSNNPNHNNILSPNSNSNTVKRFTYRDEDMENSYPTLPLSAQ